MKLLVSSGREAKGVVVECATCFISLSEVSAVHPQTALAVECMESQAFDIVHILLIFTACASIC